MDLPDDYDLPLRLHTDARFHGVFVDDDHPGLVAVVRNSHQAHGAAGASAMVDEVRTSLQQVATEQKRPLAAMVLIVDTRGIRPNTDPDFERTAAAGYAALSAQLCDTVVITRTQVGALHIHRVSRSEGAEHTIVGSGQDAGAVALDALASVSM